MTYQVIWEPKALANAERFAKDDPDGVRQVFASVDRLANDPRPKVRSEALNCCASISGSTVLYEISDSQVRVSVISLGRLH
ncbi:type II toxin-antitoxin system RelE family toxin [Streptomyces niveus]|uniref:type II toxin-antitoxin system RelE family toxin n=2 Tax=Streptomyces niveus TaxID=193462 RepID=UPI002E286E21|nr:type II toxin-antitoxin system RelE/ParE family toxin [Streptomyces niveus]